MTLVVNRIGFATMLGTFSLVALFAQTFVLETQNAVALRASRATSTSEAGS